MLQADLVYRYRKACLNEIVKEKIVQLTSNL